jgi:hypothetical protein
MIARARASSFDNPTTRVSREIQKSLDEVSSAIQRAINIRGAASGD